MSLVEGSPAVDACHCCEQSNATSALASAPVNAPGQSELRYRIGAYGSFVEEMRRRLPLLDLAEPGQPPLRPLTRLTSRDAAEPTLALLEAWACVLDILTFYQERIANEGYLRTATELESVRELARSVAYELSPGLAASVDLAFSVDDAVGSPRRATIEAGTKVMSVPGQNERPQIFEAVEELETRAEWNELHPQPQLAPPLVDSVAAAVARGGTDLYLQGTTLFLGKGDAILFTVRNWAPGDSRFELRLLDDAQVVASTGATRVRWSAPLQNAQLEQCFALRQRAASFGHNAPDWRTLPQEIRTRYGTPPENTDPNPPAFVLPTPQAGAVSLNLDNVYPKLVPGSLCLLLALNDQALLRVERTDVVAVAAFALSARVTRVLAQGAPDRLSQAFPIRQTTVWTQSEPLGGAPASANDPSPLPFGKIPATEQPSPEFPPAGGTELDKRSLDLLESLSGLEPGRRLILRGRRVRLASTIATAEIGLGEVFILLEAPLPTGSSQAGQPELRWRLQRLTEERLEHVGGAGDFRRIPSDPADAEVVESARLQDSTPPTQAGPNVSLPAKLILEAVPRHEYDRATLRVLANVVHATHGETVNNEVLGSSNGSANLAFSLKRKPLTVVASASPSGSESTLEVRVNDVLWHEVPSLFGRGPRERIYTLRIDEGGQASVIFGDGVSGARPPTGNENIIARRYRTGVGPEGEVAAGSLSLLLDKPIGIRSVTNPLPAVGGVAPADVEQARINTPVNVRATGRVVSIEDVEDFARPFAGVGNARAVLLRAPTGPVAHLTVSAADGSPIPPDAPLLDVLRRAIAGAAEPTLRLVIDTYDAVPFVLEGEALVHPDFDPGRVGALLDDVLARAFAVNSRPFGGLLTEAEILSLMQSVEGVVAAKVLALHEQNGSVPSRQTRLVALPARVAGNTILRAQVLTPAFGFPKITLRTA